LKKADEDYWDRFGSHLGTLWSRSELAQVQANRGKAGKTDKVLTPLSLVMNPDLPDAILGKKPEGKGSPTNPDAPLPSGDGLNTGMSLPTDSEVINMAELPKEEFLEIIGRSGLKVK
jgi:hypothetical protein